MSRARAAGPAATRFLVTAGRPAWRTRAPLGYNGSEFATVVLLYGLIVIVTIAVTQLPCVSVTWMVKLKVLA